MTFKKQSKKINLEAIRSEILAKDALKRVRKTGGNPFALPVTRGCSEQTRLAMDESLKQGCAFDSFSDSLMGHTAEWGQFPTESFIGYGALQQIAQNGMIRNCIKTVADDVTRQWITIKGGDDSDAEKVERLQRLQEDKYHLRELFNKAIAKVGFMGGAFIFIRTEGDDGDTPDLSLPLRLNNNCAELEEGSNLGFVVVDPINVSPLEYNTTDPLRSDYFTPQRWFVLGRNVHASRLVTMYANEPPQLLKPAYNFLGIPQAQILWDYVMHWNACRVTAQEMMRKMSLLIYYTNAQERMASMNGVSELDTVMQMLQHYRDNNSIFLANSDTDRVDNVQVGIGGVTDVVRQAQEMIAAVNRTPAVKLFGISPSGFNATGESDLRNYNDHIKSQQELYRPAVTRCLKAIQLATFGEIDPKITFDWNELDMDNEASQAGTFNARVTAISTLLDRNVISAEEARDAIKTEKSGHLDFLSDEAPRPQDGDLKTDTGEGSDLLAKLKEQFGVKHEEEKHDETHNSEGH